MKGYGFNPETESPGNIKVIYMIISVVICVVLLSGCVPIIPVI